MSVYFALGPNRESINQFMFACGIFLSSPVIYAIFIECMWYDDKNDTVADRYHVGDLLLLVIHPIRMKFLKR